ncbi:hypothetical protein HPB49_009516 [Dermacentor silvarum]|uniref:Uncharacterized protein n=1 Tax=Dermacentor silvarum TaxID=543639 RepID=A0ACB8DNX0_DERSI|nr:hypothetical protein HPB49_009516 [Dermacentor silvarum]
MAEAFAFRNKAVSPESTARGASGRRPWLVVGLITSAMLLMCTSVALFQRRFDVANYFRRPPVAAAAAAATAEDWDRPLAANATQGKIDDDLKREPQRNALSTVAASEIKAREPLQDKIKRKARTKSASRQGAEDWFSEERRCGSQGVDDGRHAAASRRHHGRRHRPRARDPATTLRREARGKGRRFADPQWRQARHEEGTARTRDCRDHAGVPCSLRFFRWKVSPQKPRARLNLVAATSQMSPDSYKKNEKLSPKIPPADLAISSTDGNHDSPEPHKGVRMVKRRRKLRRFVTVPASMPSSDPLSRLAVQAGNMTGAGPHTDKTGDTRAKEGVVIKKKEHHDALHNPVNSTAKLATRLSSAIPTRSMGRAAATDVDSSKTSEGNVSSSSTIVQVYSSSKPVNSVTLSRARDLTGTLGSTAETSGGVVDGRVTWPNEGGGDASSSVAEVSAYTRPPSQSTELTRVPSTSSIDQNRSESIAVAEGRAFVSTKTTALHQSQAQSSTAAPSTTQLSTIQPSEEGFKTRTVAKEFAAKRQPTEGSPEGLNSAASSSLLTSTTMASTSKEFVEEVVISTETSSTAPPDEIIPETEAPSSTSSPKETSSPETTTVTFSYYTGQDEWIPEDSGGYMNAPGGHPNTLKFRRRGKARPAHAISANKKELVLSGDHSSHQTMRGADASFGSTSDKPGRPETREVTSSEALHTVQQPAAKSNVKAGMSDLYSSLNAAIQEESKHDAAQSNQEMLDYGVVPHDVPVSNMAVKNQHGFLTAQNASSMPRLGSDVTNGPKATGTVTLLEQQRGSVIKMVVTHPRNANRSAGWNRSTNANPEPVAINTGDEGVQARTFETRSTNAKQDTSNTTRVVMNRNNQERQSKSMNSLTSTQRSLVAEFTTSSSPSPVAERLGKYNLSFSQTNSTESNRAHTGYEVYYTDKRNVERDSESPPNPLDIETDSPETESPSGRNKPNARPLAEDYPSAPTDGSTNSSVIPRYVEISTDIENGNSGKPQQHSTSGHLAEGSMENADNTIPTRTPQATEATTAHSVMGIHEVVTTTRGIERKTRFSAPNAKRPGVVCVYRKNHAGWVSGNTSYGLESLPYEYCASILYCCLSLRVDFSIEDLGNHSDFKRLAQIKSLNPGLETFVVIEANEWAAPLYERFISKTVHQDIFLLLAVHWMKTRAIDGAYLYWHQTEDKGGDKLVNAFRHLVGSFAKSNLKFGIILPTGTGYFANKSTLKALTEELDGSYAGVLLSPLEMDDSAFTGTLSNPMQALAEEYNKYLGDLVGTASVCPMIPFWGKTFKMQAVLQDTVLALRPVGRGAARQTSREPGKLAFFEFCRELGKSLFVFPSRENAMIGDEYVTFLTPAVPGEAPVDRRVARFLAVLRILGPRVGRLRRSLRDGALPATEDVVRVPHEASSKRVGRNRRGWSELKKQMQSVSFLFFFFFCVALCSTAGGTYCRRKLE